MSAFGPGPVTLLVAGLLCAQDASAQRGMWGTPKSEPSPCKIDALTETWSGWSVGTVTQIDISADEDTPAPVPGRFVITVPLMKKALRGPEMLAAPVIVSIWYHTERSGGALATVTAEANGAAPAVGPARWGGFDERLDVAVPYRTLWRDGELKLVIWLSAVRRAPGTWVHVVVNRIDLSCRNCLKTPARPD